MLGVLPEILFGFVPKELFPQTKQFQLAQGPCLESLLAGVTILQK